MTSGTFADLLMIVAGMGLIAVLIWNDCFCAEDAHP